MRCVCVKENSDIFARQLYIGDDDAAFGHHPLGRDLDIKIGGCERPTVVRGEIGARELSCRLQGSVVPDAVGVVIRER